MGLLMIRKANIEMKSESKKYNLKSLLLKTLAAVVVIGALGGCATYSSSSRDSAGSHSDFKRWEDSFKADERRRQSETSIIAEEERRIAAISRVQESSDYEYNKLRKRKEASEARRAAEMKKWENEEVKEWSKEAKRIAKAEKILSDQLKNSGKESGLQREKRLLSSIGMVRVSGGCYEMTGVKGKETCVDDFYMSKHEVTAGEFNDFIKETNYVTDAEKNGGCFLYTGNTAYTNNTWYSAKSYSWKDAIIGQGQKHPVTCVSWNDTVEFIKWKSQKVGIVYRLPTESEWEFAARGGGKSDRWAGTSDEKELGTYAWYSNNSDQKTHPVGSKKPNALGLHDMSGNVWEWVQGDDGAEPTKTNRVIRGGSWYSMNRYLGTDSRFDEYNSSDRDFALGFRLTIDGQIRSYNKNLASNK